MTAESGSNSFPLTCPFSNLQGDVMILATPAMTNLDRNPGVPLQCDWFDAIAVNTSAAERRAASSRPAWSRRARIEPSGHHTYHCSKSLRVLEDVCLRR